MRGKLRTKVHACLTLDAEVLDTLKIRGINVSETANKFFRSYLELSSTKIDSSTLNEELLVTEAKLMELRAAKKVIEAEQEAEKKEYQRKLDTGEIIEL